MPPLAVRESVVTFTDWLSETQASVGAEHETGRSPIKAFLTFLAAATSLVVTAGVGFVVVIVFAGPHSDILPSWLQVIVFAAAWIAVVAIPALVARATWRRLQVGARRGAR